MPGTFGLLGRPDAGSGMPRRLGVSEDGRLMVTLKGDTIVADFLRILDEYVDTRYGAAARSGPA